MFLQLISNIYSAAVSVNHRRFDRNPEMQYQCSIPVISIGNLSVGGTGKTPFTAMLTEMLIENSIEPAIIGKGYKRRSQGEFVVRNKHNILGNAIDSGDEMALLAEKLDVPIVINSTKTAAAQSVERLFNVDVIIVDDGFQHRRLHRDLDIVLLDRRTIEEHYVIPHGRLREPAKGLLRADIISVPENVELKGVVAEFAMEAVSNRRAIIVRHRTVEGVIFYANNSISHKALIAQHGDNHQDRSKENLRIDNAFKYYPVISSKMRQERFIAVSGIANPERFLDSLGNSGIDVVHSLEFGDHCHYSGNKIKTIIALAKKLDVSNVIITEKDFVKIKFFMNVLAQSNLNCFVLPVKIEICNNYSQFERKIFDVC